MQGKQQRFTESLFWLKARAFLDRLSSPHDPSLRRLMAPRKTKDSGSSRQVSLLELKGIKVEPADGNTQVYRFFLSPVFCFPPLFFVSPVTLDRCRYRSPRSRASRARWSHREHRLQPSSTRWWRPCPVPRTTRCIACSLPLARPDNDRENTRPS